jgi:hypothetical protein
MSLDGEEITVLFDDVGYRTLFLPTVLERRPLGACEGSVGWWPRASHALAAF